MRIYLLLSLISLVLFVTACDSPHPGEQAPPPPPGQDRLIVLPDDGLDPVLDLFASAQSAIRCKIYLFTAQDLRNALVQAARRGVEVRVIIEPDPTGPADDNRESFAILQNGGVQTRWASDAFRLTHEKSCVVDSELALIATFNFTNSAFRHNREYGIITTDPEVVAEVSEIFEADWEDRSYALDDGSRLILSPQNSRQRLTELIDRAHSTIWLQESTLLDDQFTDRLRAAARRGVSVSFQGPLRPQDDEAYANYTLLQNAGANVTLLPDPLIHAKAILVDGTIAAIGSVNLSHSSLSSNRELGILSLDKEVLARLAATMQDDWEGGQSLSGNIGQSVSWREAASYVGSEIIVQGRIVRTNDIGNITFLNFDPDFRNTLTIVIFAEDYHLFPQKPVVYFRDALVRIRGMVTYHEDQLQIVVKQPDQVEVIDR